jgi:two-component system, OmpR family, osmolarity sensor histidine kinase EnvZ
MIQRPFKLWPRTLWARQLLLVAALVLLGQLVAAVLVRQLVIKPRMAEWSQGIAPRAQATAPKRNFPRGWLVAALISAVLALAAAAWLQRHLNRPLERVVEAAQQLATGQAPPPLPEDGPEELARLGRSFNQMAHALTQAENERTLLLAGVSHDLRTPMTKLRLGLEITRAHMEPAIATSMERSLDEMDTIVTQFLDFARTSQPQATTEESLNDLAHSITQACADHGRPLTLELGTCPPIALQAQALHRAVSNLVENAWRHGQAPVTLRTGTAAHGGQRSVWIEVQDSGPGVPVAELERIRQPFIRGSTQRDGPPGAGLGLAIVERVARAHGGQLELHSAVGQGLRARLVLPAG